MSKTALISYPMEGLAVPEPLRYAHFHPAQSGSLFWLQTRKVCMRTVVLAGITVIFILLVALATRGPHLPVHAGDLHQVSPLPMASLPSGAVQVTATAFAAAPGAILCSDYKTVSATAGRFAEAAEDQAQDVLTHGQSRLLRGPPLPTPDVATTGCVLVQPGTPMLLESDNIVPVVSAHLGGGWVRGVTLPEMFSAPSATAQPPVHEPSVATLPDPHWERGFVRPSRWLPANALTARTTGAIQLSTGELTLAGQPYALIPQRPMRGAEPTQAAALFADPSWAATDGEWFRVAIPENAQMLNGLGLCGGNGAAWMLAMVDPDQGRSLHLAFFSAAQIPDFAPPSLHNDAPICGIFRYTPDELTAPHRIH